MSEKFAYGVDLGWVSQLEQLGYRWVDDFNQEIDPIAAAKELGANAVRFRIFFNPPKEGFWQKRENERCMLGLCDTQSVIDVAKRVQELGMDVMVGYHYSNHFADPEFQDIPVEWENDTDEMLLENVYAHTKESLLAFKAQGVEPKWVQVGNEINNGIMWPRAALKEAPEFLVQLLNRGYDAVKEVFPSCQVITHMAMVNDASMCEPFLDNFFANNGKTDMIGFSYYPYWAQIQSDGEKLKQWVAAFEEKYQMPLILVETGGMDDDVEGTKEILTHCIEAFQAVKDQRGLGVFFWEPAVNRAVIPDHYPLGAAELVDEKTLRYTKALEVYRQYANA